MSRISSVSSPFSRRIQVANGGKPEESAALSEIDLADVRAETKLKGHSLLVEGQQAKEIARIKPEVIVVVESINVQQAGDRLAVNNTADPVMVY